MTWCPRKRSYVCGKVCLDNAAPILIKPPLMRGNTVDCSCKLRPREGHLAFRGFIGGQKKVLSGSSSIGHSRMSALVYSWDMNRRCKVSDSARHAMSGCCLVALGAHLSRQMTSHGIHTHCFHRGDHPTCHSWVTGKRGCAALLIMCFPLRRAPRAVPS